MTAALCERYLPRLPCRQVLARNENTPASGCRSQDLPLGWITVQRTVSALFTFYDVHCRRRSRTWLGAGSYSSTSLLTPRCEELLELANAYYKQMQDDIANQRALRAGAGGGHPKRPRPALCPLPRRSVAQLCLRRQRGARKSLITNNNTQ